MALKLIKSAVNQNYCENTVDKCSEKEYDEADENRRKSDLLRI